MSRRSILAFVITPAVLAGVAGFFGNQIAEYFQGERSSDAAMTQDELQALRDFFKDMTKSRPKTSAAARQLIADLRGLIAIFTTEAARKMGRSLLAELETAAAELNTAEIKLAESQSQEKMRQAAEQRNDQEAKVSAERSASKSQADAKLAKERAGFALERAIRFKTR